MSASQSESSDSLEIGEEPFQPRDIAFPQRSYGVKEVVKRSFQPKFFDLFPWAHWDTPSERIFCHVCVRASRAGLITSGNADPAFITRGYQNWKEAKRVMGNHSSSRCHAEAVDRLLAIPKSCGDVGHALDSELAKQQQRSRECLLQILQVARHLARQGLAFRGRYSEEGETDGNFVQVLKLLSTNSDDLLRWLDRRTDRYTSPAIQNEILETMAHHVLRKIVSDIRGNFFTVMVDETMDTSTKEQCVFVVRWVDSNLEPHEEFIGFYTVPVTNADTLVSVILDCVARLGLSLDNCRGQCYDGASVMQGVKTGVATQIQNKQPKAIYTHCYGHSLNLAVQDMVRNVKQVKDALDTVFDLSKLLKYSAKRSAEYDRLKKEIAPEEPGFRTLCPTRWTVRASSLHSVLSNYAVLQASLDKFTEMAKHDPETSARCNGIRYQFESFDFFFGVCLGELVLQVADNLSKALQQKTLSAAEGQKLAAATVTALQNLRTSEKFQSFWHDILEKQTSLDVREPALPRKRKAPARFDPGNATSASFPATVEDLYRPIYFAAFDNTVTAIQDRFKQRGYEQYQHLEALLVKGVSGEDIDAERQAVVQLWGDDFNMVTLVTQLSILEGQLRGTPRGDISLSTIIKHVVALPEKATFMSEVITLLKLILVAPATNATSERSFSALRRLKTYLRSTMTQERLNHCAVLHVTKEECDKLSMVDIAREFVSAKEHRSSVFGKFV